MSPTWRVIHPVEPHSRHADPATHSVALLGTVKPPSTDPPDAQPAKSAILRIERTALASFSDGIIASTKLIETTDIVSSLSTYVLVPLSLTAFLLLVCVDAGLAEPFRGQARHQDQCHLSCHRRAHSQGHLTLFHDYNLNRSPELSLKYSTPRSRPTLYVKHPRCTNVS